VSSTPLSALTTLRLGGPAGRLITAGTEEELIGAVREADAAGEPLLVLAGGSNVVVADEGFPGTVVRVATRGIAHAEADGRGYLEVQAGEPWEAVVDAAQALGLAGIECLTGIPGSTGATPIQNVGAYGQEVATTVAAVRVLDRASGAVERMEPEACGFRYRSSIFRGDDRRVVLAVTLALDRSATSQPIAYAELAGALGVRVGDRVPAPAAREAVLALRRGKGMVIDPGDPDSVSAGSFFTNPVLEPPAFAALQRRVAERLGDGVAPPRFPAADGTIKTSAAWLIERAGFKRGDARGPVAISAKHTLALVNRGGATTAQLIALAREIAAGVEDAFGVALRPEPVFVGHEW
jgi:UDP-N-acetylmuramate dehydrogenase